MVDARRAYLDDRRVEVRPTGAAFAGHGLLRDNLVQGILSLLIQLVYLFTCLV